MPLVELGTTYVNLKYGWVAPQVTLSGTFLTLNMFHVDLAIPESRFIGYWGVCGWIGKCSHGNWILTVGIVNCKQY